MLILLCTRYRHGLEHSYVRKLKGLAYMFFIFDLGGGGVLSYITYTGMCRPRS